MSIGQSAVTTPTAAAVFPVRRFSVEEYHRMINADVLSEDDRVELLEGWIVTQMVRRPRHDATIEIVEAALKRIVPKGYRLRLQSAITTDDSEPEPDLAIVQGTARDHLDRHPSPEEVALVIEVAETSLERDREKARIYARAGIEQYWIVNLAAREIEIYKQPEGRGKQTGYSSREVVADDGQFSAAIGDSQEVELKVKKLLP